MKEGINVLSLFDGISAGQVALERAGVEVNRYYASEIDKYPIQVTQENYPDTIQLGDINNWREWDIDWSGIDLVMGGFPCQSWSMAGKQGGVNDERGKLLFVMMDVFNKIKEVNPDVKFLFENVKMKKEFLEYVNNVIGVEPILINSALVSAQNRNRYFWTNIEDVQLPDDRGILLRDIVEDGTVYWGAAKRGRYKKEGGTYQNLEANGTQKSNSLTTVQKDSMILSDKAIGYMNRLRNDKPRWEYHKNPLDGKAACLTANMFKGVPYGVIEEFCRRLTTLECERLQTFPDNYTGCVSNTQRYKALGNSWTVDVIAHIFEGLKK